VSVAAAAPAFSLSEGGRIHDLLSRGGLSGGPRGRLKRVAILVIIGWLPMLLLSAFAGLEPLKGFVTDLGALVRFGLVVPVTVLAEPFADLMLGRVVALFRASRIVPEARLATFDARVAKIQRQATSDTVEITLLIVALTIPHVLATSGELVATARGGWLAIDTADGHALTAAGQWYAWVGLPLVEFLILRWLWRSICWWRLLWFTSTLPLAVTPAHPDRSAGLAFLSLAPTGFVPFFIALSLLASVGLALDMKNHGTTLAAVAPLVAAFVVVEVVLLIVPQLFFVPVLGRARRTAIQHYAMTGVAIAREFDAEWVDRPLAERGQLLDSSHASTMTDFAATYGLIAAMRPVPFSMREILALIVPLIAPFLPLLLFEYSAKELLTQVLRLVR
jgi:hypothetical protein